MKEKEVRIKIDSDNKNLILRNCNDISTEERIIDVTLGKYGFESLSIDGYIIRLRNKNNKKTIECKQRVNQNEWNEYIINVSSFDDAIDFFNAMGYKSYLLLDKRRIRAKYNNLELAFDSVDMLGEYLEIEFQNSNINEVYEFLSDFHLNDDFQELYGDIMKKKIESNDEFRKKFNEKIKKIDCFNKKEIKEII